MATAANPLIGASWGSMPSPSASTFANPLFGPVAGPPTPGNPEGAPTGTGPWGNPGHLDNPSSNTKDQNRNIGLLNVEQAQFRNALLPFFTNAMSGLAGPAADFFKQLMDLGSPYYAQKQQAGFEQGTKNNNDAAAQARQKIAASGYGFAPSGTEAGMVGGMAEQGAENLSQNFLQQLFQNENLQASAGSALAQIAQMFNPAQLFGNVNNAASTQGPAAAEQVGAILQGAGSLFSGLKKPPSG